MRILSALKDPDTPYWTGDHGEIEATGKDVQRFKKGDQVLNIYGKAVRCLYHTACLPEDGLSYATDRILTLKPSSVTWEEAAAVPSRGTLALFSYERENTERTKVLIY